jgi:hypothetical protein
MGSSAAFVPECVGNEEVLECRILVGYVDFLGGWGDIVMVREVTVSHGVRNVFTSLLHLQTAQNSCIYVLYYMFCYISSPCSVLLLYVTAGMRWSGV